MKDTQNGFIIPGVYFKNTRAGQVTQIAEFKRIVTAESLASAIAKPYKLIPPDDLKQIALIKNTEADTFTFVFAPKLTRLYHLFFLLP